MGKNLPCQISVRKVISSHLFRHACLERALYRVSNEIIRTGMMAGRKQRQRLGSPNFSDLLKSPAIH
jgi:hypothetical protein